MSEKRAHRPRRLLAALAAGIVGFGGLLALAPAAHAAPSYGNIDEDATGSIIVHKHENQVGTDAVQNPEGTGTAIPSAPVTGVEFTAYEILGPDGRPLDLTVPGTWDYLEDLVVSADGKSLTGGPGAPNGPWTVGSKAAGSATTDADGNATIALDSIGAYVVVETAAPSSVVQQALPFIVTIPFPWTDGWLYDVNVYPKNGLADISKSIAPQSGLGLGSVASFPVTTKVPGLAPGTEFDSYVVEDMLDERLGRVGVGSVTLDGAAVDEAYYDVKIDGNLVRVAFTDAGLTWLLSQGGKSIVVTFEGTVESLGNGVIENSATLFVNDPSESNGIDSNTVHTNWGDVVIRKVDSSAKAAGLKGAVFEVFAAASPYADCTAAVPSGSALTVGGATQFRSDENGRVVIPGLFVSDSVNPAVDAGQRCYVLKEVQAPAGFVTPTGEAALTPVAVKTGETVGVDVTIANVQQGAPQLPLTGSEARLLMIGAGAAVLAVAVGVILIGRRRASRH